MAGGLRTNKLHRRFATVDDLDDITNVAQVGFPDDPEFNYRFPLRGAYPEDNKKWVRKEYEEYLEQSEKFAVLVVTAPVELDDQECHKPISLAVWDISVLTKPKGSDLGFNTRRDINKEHFLEFSKGLEQAYQQHFAVYGNEQYHLWLLATHPDFRRQGAATMLCMWGIENAARRNYAVTVLASSMGKALYEHLGFHLLGTVTIQVAGENEKLVVYCLQYDAGEKAVSKGKLFLIFDGLRWLSGLSFVSA